MVTCLFPFLLLSHALQEILAKSVDSITTKMSLQLCRCFKLAFSVFMLAARIVFPLKISEDTMKAIKHNKFYAIGCVPFNSENPELSLSKGTGAIGLAKLEYEIYSIISKKISSRSLPDGDDFTQALLEYVEDYNTTAGSLMQSGMSMEKAVQSVVENMIAVYRMVRRFRNYIQPWILERKKRKALPFQTEVMHAINPSGQSLELFTNDFYISIIPIITTQFIMDWTAEDICKGTIEGMELGSTLQAVHCLEIGVHAIASGMYPIGIEWIELAISKATHENDTSVNIKFATEVLDKAYIKHDERWRPRNLRNFEETYYEHRLNDTVIGREEKLWRKWRKQREYEGELDTEAEAQDMEGFSKTCQGHLQQPQHMKSKLFCWLETSVHPTWKIGPLKVELLSGFPDDMVLFHDIISKSLTKDVIEYCEPLLGPSALNSSTVNPKTRISFACSVEDPTLGRRLDGLTERTTGLRTKGTMFNHVSYYPAGGHMNLHTDRLRFQEVPDEYITTVIYYFTAPEVGGETAFTGAGLRLKPPAGSAVLWYYTFKSGGLRKGRAHGSCPLVKGQKWIAIKGLQFLKQTHLVCDTEEDARMEYLVNGRSKYT